jgi:hypothetical protein
MLQKQARVQNPDKDEVADQLESICRARPIRCFVAGARLAADGLM